ncbi:delta-like protein C [Anneissia japonica]|uniref:delta-like protein C n=1 Tax=Anneissia japonica TaxID=1529436 RepID=UPI0014259EA4|nr:delta-like protein C [Anneissia japonica]
MPSSAQCGHNRDAGVDCNGGPCSSQPCQNGGKCHELSSGSRECICLDGFGGIDCEDQSQSEKGGFSASSSTYSLGIISIITVSVCLAMFFMFLIISYIVMKVVNRDVENNVIVVIPTAPSINDMEMDEQQMDVDLMEARSYTDEESYRKEEVEGNY